MRSGTATESDHAADDLRVFGRMSAELADVVEARLTHKGCKDPLDNLVSASSGHVRDWMIRKARLAESLRVSHSTASKLCQIHDQGMQGVAEYSTRAARVAHRALEEWRGV